MMPTTTNKPVNLATVIHESEAAAAEAAAAQAKARELATKADVARQRAEAEREAAARRHLDTLQAQYPDARAAATTAVGDAREALEEAVRDGGDIFKSYRSWADAMVRAWEIESEVQQARHYLGVAARSTEPPRFDFGHDIAAIIDRHTLELQDAALERIRERRASFLNGATHD